MKELSLKKIQRQDTILLNMYRDFVVLEQEPVGSIQLENRRDAGKNLVESIGDHILILEGAVDGKDEIDRFQYITDRIIFWKNLLLHQFGVFYNSKKISVPQFFSAD